MFERDFLKISGWGPFRIPGERARLERIKSEATELFELARQVTREKSVPRGGGNSDRSSDDDDDGDMRGRNLQQRAARRGSEHTQKQRRLGDRYLVYEPTSRPVRGDDVLALQEQLRDLGYGKDLLLDGVFGPVTNRALVEFQSAYGIRDDGVCGKVTLVVLRYLRSERVDAKNPASKEALENIKWSASEQPEGFIVIDPVYLQGEEENDVLTVVQRLTEEKIEDHVGRSTLHPQGKPIKGDQRLSPSDRARFANGMKAILVISISLETDARKPSGVSTFYSTEDHTGSHVSKALAAYIQEELVTATGAEDRGVHAEDTELFSNTIAPSVRVVIGNIGHAEERSRLVENVTYLESIAQGIACGVRRLYLLGARRLPFAESAERPGK